MKRLLGLALSLLAFAAITPGREIEKTATMSDHGMTFYVWPKLHIPKGWVHDQDKSTETSCNMLIPKGKTFDNAESVIFARAFYEPDKKKRGTLQEFITADMKNFKEANPKAVVKELSKPIPIAKHKHLRTFTFSYSNFDVDFPNSNFDVVCYGVEGNYWTVFSISSKSKKSLARDLPVFRAMMAKYK